MRTASAKVFTFFENFERFLEKNLKRFFWKSWTFMRKIWRDFFWKYFEFFWNWFESFFWKKFQDIFWKYFERFLENILRDFLCGYFKSFVCGSFERFDIIIHISSLVFPWLHMGKICLTSKNGQLMNEWMNDRHQWLIEMLCI